jgi:ADP-ribose pyrophosphatase YjhB (NUDIX family)
MQRVRAVLFHKDKLVLMKRVWEKHEYYVFPGGGVEGDETHEEALIRECKEELGILVAPGKLFAEQDFRGDHEFFYICEYVSGKVGTGEGEEFSRPVEYNGTHEAVEITKMEYESVEVLPEDIATKVLQLFPE